jgi:hypothetical protein
MATQALTDISAVLSEQLAPELTKAFNRISVLAGLAPKANGRGENCTWGVQFTGATAATFSEGADVSTYNQDASVQATLSWGQYRSSFGVSGLAQAAAQSAMNSPAEIMRIIEDNASNAMEVIASKIDLDCFSGSGSNSIIGLDSALLATGTYAGIAKGTYSEWAGNYLSNSGTARELTKALLDQLEASVFDACGMSPNVIVASSAVCRKYESLFDSISRVVLAQNTDLAVNRADMSQVSVSSTNGFTGFTYKGMPVFRARNATAGCLYMLNSNMFEIQSLPQGRINTATQASEQSLVAGAARVPVGLNVRVEAMAKTGDADKFTVKCYPALKVRKPNAHGLLVDISTT